METAAMTARGPECRHGDSAMIELGGTEETLGADKSQTLSGGDRGVFERIASPQA